MTKALKIICLIWILESYHHLFLVISTALKWFYGILKLLGQADKQRVPTYLEEWSLNDIHEQGETGN